MLRATSLLLPLVLMSACASTAPAATSAPAATAGMDASALGANHWRLATATDAAGQPLGALFADPAKPVQLDFASGNLAIHAACNHLRGSYTLTGSTLAVGPIAATMIGCPDALQAQDRTIAALLDQPLQVRRLDAGNLVLAAADGSVLIFAGAPTAETRYGGPGRTVFWEVAAHTRPCPHPLMADAQCLQVRELHYDANGIRQATPGQFTHFYGQIEGYAHQPGVRNVLRLKQYDIANPPADASAHAWVLDMTVESERIAP